MGLEVSDCIAVIQDAKTTGRLHVDSNALEFRAEEIRWTVKVGKGTTARVSGELLTVRRGSKSATFELGAAAEKWADKILHPPTLGKKLGLKPHLKFWLTPGFEETFLEELEALEMQAVRSPKDCEIAFVLMQDSKQLKLFDKVAKAASVGVHLWAVWPKGIDAIRQSEVIAHARAYGMGPGKGIAFNDTLSAMRFTLKS